MRFENQVAVLTGAARGIGAATAQLMAGEGAAVVVSDLEGEPAAEVVAEIAAAGGRAIAVSCNVTKRADVEALFEQAVSAYGQVDIVVASAGVLRDNPIDLMSDDDWDTVIDIHLKGAFLTAQAAQRRMTPRRFGKIVFLSSISALGNDRGQANYATAKMGLQGMARTLAIELGRFNINVNTVAPGFIETRLPRITAARLGIDYETFRTNAAAMSALQRVGSADEIASVIAFLCSADASYVSGQTIYVRGGP